MLPADFHFDLPPELIARHPSERRDASRLLVLPRVAGAVSHHHFYDLPTLLRPGDCLVLNDSRVMPARLRVRRASGGQAELLLIHEAAPGVWDALARPARKLPPGARLTLPGGAGQAEILEQPAGLPEADRSRRVRFHLEGGLTVPEFMERHGEMPLPPYILQQRRLDAEKAAPPHNSPATPAGLEGAMPEPPGPAEPQAQEDRARYQTVYARDSGSAAAPTAGLHFTPELLGSLAARGVEIRRVTLHVGLGTFQPLGPGAVETQRLHSERFSIDPENAAAIEAARLDPARRVIAVGTTSVRTLETCFAMQAGRVAPMTGASQLFIYPGYHFGVVDGMITNFHLPESSLIMLVSALAGRERVLEAYREAVANHYRFYSYGDAMLIFPS